MIAVTGNESLKMVTEMR